METTVLEHSAVVITHHDRDKCVGEFCTVHNRSDHRMRHFPQHFREDNGLMERICPHGIGHPDPDDPQSVGIGSIHGCDGCCE